MVSKVLWESIYPTLISYLLRIFHIYMFQQEVQSSFCSNWQLLWRNFGLRFF